MNLISRDLLLAPRLDSRIVKFARRSSKTASRSAQGTVISPEQVIEEVLAKAKENDEAFREEDDALDALAMIEDIDEGVRRTVRLDSDLDGWLVRKANEMNISPNGVASKVLAARMLTQREQTAACPSR